MMLLTNYILSHVDCLKLRLTDSYSTHRAVLDLFPAEKKGDSRILFVDKGFHKGKRQILILSGTTPEIAPYGAISKQPVPEHFLEYPAYNFEVVVNPVRRQNATGRIEPVRKRESIRVWFEERSQKSWGFACVNFQVAEVWADKFHKNAQTEVTLSKARLTGALKVTDVESFKKAFREGIGRGKAFGCGLLQLRPAYGKNGERSE